MADISFDVDTSIIEQGMLFLQEQVIRSTVVAINMTAKEVRKRVQVTLPDDFKLRSDFLANMVKQDNANKHVSSDKYLTAYVGMAEKAKFMELHLDGGTKQGGYMPTEGVGAPQHTKDRDLNLAVQKELKPKRLLSKRTGLYFLGKLASGKRVLFEKIGTSHPRQRARRGSAAATQAALARYSALGPDATKKERKAALKGASSSVARDSYVFDHDAIIAYMFPDHTDVKKTWHLEDVARMAVAEAWPKYAHQMLNEMLIKHFAP